MLRWMIGFAAAAVSWFVLVRQYAWDSATGAFKPSSAAELAGFTALALAVGAGVYLLSRPNAGAKFKKLRAAFLARREQLNALAPGEARLIDLLEHEPMLETVGRNQPVQTQDALLAALGDEVTPEQAREIIAKAAVHRAGLSPNDNREHAILTHAWREGDFGVRVYSCDYSFVAAYRTVTQSHLRRLSGNALLVSAKHRHVFVHRRAEGPRGGAYPGALHIVGGNLEPQRDHESTARTMAREVKEEFELGAGDVTVSAGDAPVLLFEEPNTRWQAAVFLGVEVAEADALKVITAKGKTALQTDEGVVLAFAYDDIPEMLNQKWVPSGRAALLAWVAIGGPVSGRKTLSTAQSRRILASAGLS